MFIIASLVALLCPCIVSSLLSLRFVIRLVCTSLGPPRSPACAFRSARVASVVWGPSVITLLLLTPWGPHPSAHSQSRIAVAILARFC
jgi:hypothetical protein